MTLVGLVSLGDFAWAAHRGSPNGRLAFDSVRGGGDPSVSCSARCIYAIDAPPDPNTEDPTPTTEPTTPHQRLRGRETVVVAADPGFRRTTDDLHRFPAHVGRRHKHLSNVGPGFRHAWRTGASDAWRGSGVGP
jgi:hypothetical protein